MEGYLYFYWRFTRIAHFRLLVRVFCPRTLRIQVACLFLGFWGGQSRCDLAAEACITNRMTKELLFGDEHTTRSH